MNIGITFTDNYGYEEINFIPTGHIWFESIDRHDKWFIDFDMLNSYSNGKYEQVELEVINKINSYLIKNNIDSHLLWCSKSEGYLFVFNNENFLKNDDWKNFINEFDCQVYCVGYKNFNKNLFDRLRKSVKYIELHNQQLNKIDNYSEIFNNDSLNYTIEQLLLENEIECNNELIGINYQIDKENWIVLTSLITRFDKDSLEYDIESIEAYKSTYPKNHKFVNIQINITNEEFN